MPRSLGSFCTASAEATLSRAWLTVGLLWFVACLNYLDRVMITTMRQSLIAAIPMTEAQFGLLTTVFLLVYAVLSPAAGFLADRVGRSRVIVFSLVAWSAITWLTAHATTYGVLLTTRALMGISEACYIPAAVALIADYHGPRTRSLANGAHLSGVMVGAGLGGIGGWIAERHGWATAFSWFGQVGIALAIVVWLYLRDRPVAETIGAAAAGGRVSWGEAMESLFARRQFVFALAAWGLLGASVWAVVGWMPTYLTERFHLTQGAGGFSATGWYHGASLVGIFLGGIWADAWSRTRFNAPMLVPLIGLCVAAPAILVVGSTGTLALGLAGLALFGLTKAFADANMMPILTLVCDGRYRATAYGILNFLSCVVGALTIYAGGVLRDRHISVNAIFLFGAASVLVCAGLLYLVLRSSRQTGVAPSSPAATAQPSPGAAAPSS